MLIQEFEPPMRFEPLMGFEPPMEFEPPMGFEPPTSLARFSVGLEQILVMQLIPNLCTFALCF